MGLVAAWHFWDRRRNCWLTSAAAIHKNGSSTWWRQGSASYVPTTGTHSGVAVTCPNSEQFIHFGGRVEVPLCDYRLLIFDPFSQQKQNWHQLKVSVSPVLTEGQKDHSSPLIQIHKHEELTCNINRAPSLGHFPCPLGLTCSSYSHLNACYLRGFGIGLHLKVSYLCSPPQNLSIRNIHCYVTKAAALHSV